jgi:hypothetical protein
MSHRDLASIWSALQNRPDIDNILQETIGLYFLDTLMLRGDRKLLRARAFEHVVELRAIFDLQRTYLQASCPSTETQRALLKPGLLLSALFHVLELKASAFRTEDDLPGHETHCSFICQTQLSGLRALMLRSQKIFRRECQSLFRLLEEAWDCELLSDANQFLVLLCRKMITELSSQSDGKTYSKPACGTVILPDFHHGLVSISKGDSNAMSVNNPSILLKNEKMQW